MLRDIRTNYQHLKLEEKDLTIHPFELFQRWLNEALNNKLDEPTAMTLSTCADGQPDSRIVLLKELTSKGFVFFTNYNSAKGQQIEINKWCALNFFWPKMERQVRVKGTITKLSTSQSSEYFRSRPRDSKLGAWASNQSCVLKNRQELENKYNYYNDLFKNQDIRKPENWGGYQISPTEVEFWQGRPNRLHDRFRYYLMKNEWIIKRLAP